MKREQMIEEFAEQCSGYDYNPDLAMKRIIKAVKWAYAHSNIKSITKVLDSIGYEEIATHNTEDSYDTLYIKIKMTGGSCSTYICVPRELLNRKVEKRFFPDRFIFFDSRKIII